MGASLDRADRGGCLSPEELLRIAAVLKSARQTKAYSEGEGRSAQEPGVLDVEDDECLHRIGLGTPDVPATVAQLRQRGVEFVASKGSELESRGALTRTVMGSVMFELVHDDRS